MFKKIGLSKYSIHLGMVLYWFCILFLLKFIFSHFTLFQLLNNEDKNDIIFILIFGFVLNVVSNIMITLTPTWTKSRTVIKVTLQSIFLTVILIAIDYEFDKNNISVLNFLNSFKTGQNFQIPDNLFENPVVIFLLSLGLFGLFFYNVSLSLKADLIRIRLSLIKEKAEMEKDRKYGKQLSLKL